MAVVVAVHSLNEGLQLFLVRLDFAEAYDVHGNVVLLERLAQLGERGSIGLEWAADEEDHPLMLILVLSVLQRQLSIMTKTEFVSCFCDLAKHHRQK